MELINPDKNSEWVRYNPHADTYDTGDGTKVSAFLIDGVETLADIFHTANIREGQRAMMSKIMRYFYESV